MKDKLIVVVFLVISSAALSFAQGKDQHGAAQSPQPIQKNPGLPAAKVGKIEALIAAWMAQHKAPGLSVAIVTDNQLRWSNGYGEFSSYV